MELIKRLSVFILFSVAFFMPRNLYAEQYRCIHAWDDKHISSAQGIAVDDLNKDVYIVDKDDRKVKKFNRLGMYIDELEAGFHIPVDIAVARAGGPGFIYVVDKETHKIIQSDYNFDLLIEWGGYGTSDGEFKEPIAIGLDKNWTIYVLEGEGQRVQLFDFVGRHESTIDLPPDIVPSSLAVTEDGDFYVGYETHQIQKFNKDGTLLYEFSVSHIPEYITVDKGENLLVSLSNQQLIKYDPNGVNLGTVIDSGVYGTAIDPDDAYLYTTDGSNVVKSYAHDNVLISGRIKDPNGVGVRVGTVTLTTHEGSTDIYPSDDGVYMFEVPYGSLDVQVVPTYHKGYFDRSIDHYFLLTNDRPCQDFTLTFSQYEITGHIYDPNFNAVSGVTLTLTGISATGTVSFTSLTDSNGYYSFVDIIPGDYTVTPHNEYRFFTLSSHTYTDLGSDQSGQNFDASFPHYEITGYIEDNSGIRLNNATITLTGTSSTGPVNLSYVTSSNGEYEFEVMGGGLYNKA